MVGMTRALFGFSVGVLLAREFGRRGSSKESIFFLVPCIAVLIAICIGTRYRAGLDAACVFILFPLLVYIGTRIGPPSWLRPAATFLGLTSYAVYLLHLHLPTAANAIADRILPARLHSETGVAVAITIALLPLYWAVDRYYDAPVRRWLAAKSSPVRERSQPAST